ncbi:MAG: cardiolipin synthase [Planctomycetota bacterium]|jgi:cardiolipin synthase
MWSWIFLVAHLLGIISSIHSVMTTRTSQGTIAWAVSLNTIPILAVPAYWFLGRSRFQGYVTSRQGTDNALREYVEKAAEGVRPHRVPEDEISQAGRAAERLVDIPYLDGNAVELLIDGDATFASILAGIDSAQKYILFQFFIVKDDEIGREVKKHLIAKAKEGVKVWFVYDEVGSHDLPDSYTRELKDAGVEIREFNTRKGRGNRFQLNFRNHRKVVVVDGAVAWVGGHNVGDEYLGRDPKFGHWRDTHVRIEGPAALAAQLSFLEDWNWAAGKILDLDWTPRPAANSDIPVLIAPSGPADELETANLMFVHAINSAEERIWIASPYFVPDESVVVALQLAGLRGVDVKVLIPEKADHLLVWLAAFSYLEDSTRTGVHLYRYEDGFLHEKAMLIDDRVACVGTANFDNRSFRLNFEITAIIHDEKFAADVKAMFERDFEKSRRMEESEYEKKPFWFRFAVRLARLTSPVQ